MTQEQQHQVEDLNDQMLVRRQKMEQLRENGIDPFGKRFERTHNSEELHELFDPRTKEELAEMGLTASVAGRMITRRGKGKASKDAETWKKHVETMEKAGIEKWSN